MKYLGIIWNNQKNNIDALTKVKSFIEKQGSTLTGIENSWISFFYWGQKQCNTSNNIYKSKNSILIGRVFSKSNYKALTQETYNTFSSASTYHWSQDYWGSYIEISYCYEEKTFKALRDPQGVLNFFYIKLPDNNIIFSSEISILYKALSLKAEYDWQYLSSFILYGDAYTQSTFHRSIKELPSGCSLSISRNSNNLKYEWNPLLSTKHTHPDEIIETLYKSIEAWISPYENIILSLSGGVDSSSLAFCLKKALRPSQKLTAVSIYHSQIKSSNELHYARAVCQETGIGLTEIELSGYLPFSPPKSKTFLPNKPSTQLLGLNFLEARANILSSFSPYLFVTGYAGDAIFMSSPPIKSIVDYLFQKKISGIFVKIQELSTFYRKPYYEILEECLGAIKEYLTSTQAKNYTIDSEQNISWINNGFRENSLSPIIHPAFNNFKTQRILPGKLEHITCICQMLAAGNLQGEAFNGVEYYYPFLDQPIIELALGFPSYDLYSKGYDRFPIRNAISTHFKTTTLWRKDKGNFTAFAQLGLRENLDYIFELTLKGAFVKSQLIDKHKLEAHILRVAAGYKESLQPLTRLIATETFLRAWR
jgi:asparagine synthase (glutamine-hydrolysing)